MTGDDAEHGPDVVLLLTQEHNELARDLADLLHISDPTTFRAQIEQVAARLSRHEVAEEIAVYPVLAQLGRGSELRRQALTQEREAKLMLQRILRREFWWPRGKQIRRMLEQFADQLREHARFEEAQLFPLLELCEDEHKLQMMGAWVENAESVAPTRPHPHAPQRLPGLIASGPVFALADRVRDIARRKIEGH